MPAPGSVHRPLPVLQVIGMLLAGISTGVSILALARVFGSI